MNNFYYSFNTVRCIEIELTNLEIISFKDDNRQLMYYISLLKGGIHCA